MAGAARGQTLFNLLDVRGRSGRLECLSIVSLWVIWVAARRVLVGEGDWALILGIGGAISAALILACVRRLHDLGRTGWWALLAFIPFVNFAFFFWLTTAPGEAGSNEFGLPVTYLNGT